MRLPKRIAVLIASALLLIGIGATVAVANDGGPESSPKACTVVTPDHAAANAANAVTEAADDVSTEADNKQGDDQQGDEQEGQQGHDEQGDEQGDCNDDGDNGDGD